MTAYPLYVNAIMLMVLAMVQTMVRFPVQIANQYASLVSPMIACHQALIQFAQANTTTYGTIPKASIDAYLPPGSTDPGSFTFIITAPGIVDTYLTVPVKAQGTVIAAVQRLTLNNVFAGIVAGGNIVPQNPSQQTPVATGVPNGVIAIQTVVRNH